MTYLKSLIFNRAQIAVKIGMSPSLFRAKLNNINWNRFNMDELEQIDKAIKDVIDGSNVNRMMLLDFCENISLPAIDLIKEGYFDYVVDHYFNNRE